MRSAVVFLCCALSGNSAAAQAPKEGTDAVELKGDVDTLPIDPDDGAEAPLDPSEQANDLPIEPVEPAKPVEPPPAPPPPSSPSSLSPEVPAPLPPLPPLPPLACPKDAHCIADAELVALMLRYRKSLETEKTKDLPRTRMLMERLALTDDVRVVPLLVRASRTTSLPTRHAALGFLARFPSVPLARDRLLETLRPEGNLADAEAALPGILTSKMAPIPCAPMATCAPDPHFLAALMAISGGATVGEVRRGVEALGRLGDPRGLGIVVSQTTSQSMPIRHAALVALNGFDDDRAQKQMQRILKTRDLPDVTPLLQHLKAHPRPWLQKTALLVRDREGDGFRGLADEVLMAVAPDVIAEIQAREEAEKERLRRAEREEDRAAKIAAARRAQEEAEREQKRRQDAEEREEFIRRYGTRSGVAASAALAGAYGGAFAGAHLGSLFPGADATTEFFYGGWGSLFGAVSAATLSWFLLSDVELTLEDVAMTTSGSAMGAWTGAWVPTLIGGEDVDRRFAGYSAAVGHLGGLGVASVAAAYLDPKWSDVAEVNAFVVAANAAAAGVLMASPFDVDARVAAGAYIGATMAGVAAGAAATSVHDLETRDIVHISALTLGASGAGVFAGWAAGQFAPSGPTTHVWGGALFGASAGAMTGIGLAALDLTPGYGGDLYEVYAAGTGAAAGLGAGLLLGTVADPIDGIPASFLPLAMAAGGTVGGMLTTAAVPNGVSLDVGDLLLQPLIVGLALYQTGGLGFAANADPLLTIGSSLLVPAAVSATLLHTAPLVSPSLGDVAMIGFMTASGAAVAALATASASARFGDAVEPWMWIAATAVGMDLGVLSAIGLNFLDVEQLGWMVSYVAAVSVTTTFALSFPGALLVPLTDGAVQVPDVILATSALGLAIGLSTVWLIDFNIVPKLNLDEHLPLSLPDGLVVQPSVAPLPSRDGREMVPVAGVTGTF